MRSNATVAGGAVGAPAGDRRVARPLVLVGAGDPLPSLPRPAPPHPLGAVAIVMVLGAVVTLAGVVTTLFPGILPALLLP